MILFVSFLLSLLTTVFLGWRAVRIFRKTGDQAAVLALFIVFFWTLAGSLPLIIDQAISYRAYHIGFTYYYLMEKMFPFSVDEHYLSALGYYCAFAVLFAFVLEILLNKGERHSAELPPLAVSRLTLLMCLFMAGSMYAGKEALQIGLEGSASFYEAKNTLNGLSHKLMEVFNLLAIHTFMAGVVALLTRKGPASKASWWLHMGLGMLLVSYLTVIGDRSSIFGAALWGLLAVYHFAPAKANQKVASLALILAVVVLPGSKVREMVVPSNHVEATVSNTKPFTINRIAHVPRRPETAIAKAGSAIFTNELFAAHLSMPACYALDVDQKPLVSFKYLLGRLTGKDSLETVYDHYAQSAGFEEGQGYTIHHATAWYLNVGWGGCILAAFVLALLVSLSSLAQRFLNISARYRWLPILIGFFIVAFFPALIRSGPEAYKALLLEGIGMPLFVVLLAALSLPKSLSIK